MPSESTTLNKLLNKNKSTNFQTINFFNKAAVKRLKLEKDSATSQAAQLEMLKTHQRLLRVTGDAASAKKLQRRQLHSAIQIASMPQHRFVQEYSSAFKADGVDAGQQAAQAHRTALAIKTNVVLQHQAAAQANAPHYNAMRVSNLKAATDAALKTVPSYSDLFGTVDFCTCPECRSIFSPAAYFVDLMRLQDQYIDAPEASRLSKRRPDLNTLELSCANTNNTVPKLELVNEILEHALNEDGDSSQVFSYAVLDEAVYPFNLPFSLPQTQIRTYLRQENTALWQLWQQLIPAGTTETNAVLLDQAQVTAAQWNIVSSQDPDDAIQERYGTTALGMLNQVPFFLQQTGLNIEQLTELIDGDLSQEEKAAGMRVSFFINFQQEEDPELRQGRKKKEVEPKPIVFDTPITKEKLANLDVSVNYRLDRVNRFVRLALYLGWSFPDLNWLLECYNGAEEIDDGLLPYLGWMQLQLASDGATNVNQLCGMLFQLKQTGKGSGQSYFESIFNAPYVPALPGGRKWDEDTLWEVPGVESPQNENDNEAIQAALEAALKLSTNDLITIGQLLLETGDFEGNSIPFSLQNLSVLYRLSCLPNVTGMPLGACLAALRWAEGDDSAKQLAGNEAGAVLKQLKYLQEAAAALHRLPFSAFQIDYFLTGSSDDRSIQNQVLGANEINNFATQVRNTLQLQGAQEQGRQRQKQADDSGREDAFVLLLTGLVEAPAEITRIVANWVELTVDDIPEREGEKNDLPDATINKLRALQQYTAMLSACGFSEEETRFLDSNPDSFGVGKLPEFSWQNFRALFAFKQLIVQLGDTQNRLVHFIQTGQEASVLAAITGWSEDQINWLLNPVKPSKTALNMHSAVGLIQMQHWFELAGRLGISVAAMQHLVGLLNGNNAESAYEIAAANLWGGLSGLYSATPSVLGTMAGSIREQKRGALLPLVQWQLNGGIGVLGTSVAYKSPRDLFNHFLIDVEVSNAVETSRVLEAVSTVQLYIYRSRNNLELDTTVHDELNTWWEWIGNYRVWEANREVFLYPENYIQPELRSNGTPEFEALLSDLQQGDLSDQAHISAAFNDYMEAFDRLANLQLQGSAARSYELTYPCKDVCTVAVSSDQPRRWFYRVATFEATAANGNKYVPVDWGIWKEIDQNINPIGPVNPVFAFGVWHVFWVETYREQATKTTEQGEQTVAKTVARILFSYYNLNGDWAAPQVLAEGLTSTNEDFSDPDYNTVYPVFYNSTQSIVVPYGRSSFKVYEYTLNRILPTIGTSISFASPSPLPQSPAILNVLRSGTLGAFTYMGQTGRNSIWDGRSQSCSFWVWYEKGQDSEENIPILNELEVTQSGLLRRSEADEALKVKLPAKQWNHIAFNYDFQLWFPTGNLVDYPCFMPFDGWLYAAWVTQSTKEVWWGKYDADTLRFVTGGSVGWNSTAVVNATLEVHKGNLYMGWFGKYLGSSVTDLQVLKIAGSQDSFHQTFSTSGINTEKRIQLISSRDSLNLIAVATEGARLGMMPVLDGDAAATKQNFVQFDGCSAISYNSNDWCCAKVNNRIVLSYVSTASTYSGRFGFIEHKSEQEYIEDTSKWVTKHSYSLVDEKTVPDLVGTNTYAAVALNAADFMVMGRKDEKIVFNKLKVSSSGAFAVVDRKETTWANEPKHTTVLADGNTAIAVICSNAGRVVNVEEASDNEFIVVNGEVYNGFTPSKSIATSIDLGKLGTRSLNGRFMEFVLLEHPLLPVEGQRMYMEGKAGLLQDFDRTYSIADEKEFEPYGEVVDVQNILGQPNWFTVDWEGAWYLNIPQKEVLGLAVYLKVFRLNSPASTELRYAINNGGTAGLLQLANQQLSEPDFKDLQPNAVIIPEDHYPSTNTADLNTVGSVYHWEIFFHIPFLIASELNRHQRFAAARDWFEYVFNPTINQEHDSTNDKYWRFVGLRSATNKILEAELHNPPAEEIKEELTDAVQLSAYHNDPFNPHAIAALRPIAYQKTMVMHYVQNLIDWGDRLFAQYTQESVREATMLYVLAWDLLGKQPDNMGACPLPEAADLKALTEAAKAKDWEAGKLGEFLVALENKLATVGVQNVKDTPANYLADVYFGIPDNERFRAYWDTVEQRLWNIRHALNIDGKAQLLSLFAPKLDPGMLTNALANGQSLASIVDVASVAAPYYRFSFMVQKARDLCQQVIGLGQSLLSALEKKDAESLSLLMSGNEQNLLALNLDSRQYSIGEAEQTIESLQASIASAAMRRAHYEQLISAGRLPAEQTALDYQNNALALTTQAMIIQNLSSISYLLPNVFGLANGGMQYGDAVRVGADALQSLAHHAQTAGGIASMNAEFQRRNQDWGLQEQMAAYDVDQLTWQLQAAELRLLMARRELTVLEQNIAQVQKVEGFYKNKFTSAELYQWMAGKLSGLFFQTYELAVQTAQQAQAAWNYEKASKHQFIKAGYWDNLYQGLLAGESLMHDIQRMETAYLQENKRRLELTKTVSLAQHDPVALQDLRNTGKCTFGFTAADFDWDFDNHYQRQLVSVSVSFPVLLGPYQNVHATLTQTANEILALPKTEGVTWFYDPDSLDEKPSCIINNNLTGTEQVALTQAMNDNGLFTLNFNDERFLPFEGTGAISQWELTMPHETNPINFNSLSDVVVELRYAAVAGEPDFQNAVKQHRNAQGYLGTSLSSFAQLNPAGFNAFLNEGKNFSFESKQLPVRGGFKSYQIQSVCLALLLTPAGSTAAFEAATVYLIEPAPAEGKSALEFSTKDALPMVGVNSPMDGHLTFSWTKPEPEPDPEQWTGQEFVNADNVLDVLVVVHYKAEVK